MLAKKIENYFDRLWPIHRSLSGPGYNKSLEILSEIVPFNLISFPTGQKVFDWTIPKEWHVHDAYVIDPNGQKRFDVKKNNLHLLGYSAPFHGNVSLKTLKENIYTLPDMPTAIPYMTSYYEERWGFCAAHEELQSLPEGEYQVVVDTELKEGNLVLGEKLLEGDSEEEILFSSYFCHPSMANNELAGPLVLAFLYQRLATQTKRKYSYRFVLCPETIGSIAYLSLRGSHFNKHLKAGYVLTCIGDSGTFTYKQTRQGNTIADHAAELVLAETGDHTIKPFSPIGSDERQYCSPGFNLPVGSLMRTMYCNFSEYHTSLDNKTFISFENISTSIDICINIVKAIENNIFWESTCMECEPFLSRHNLYPTVHSVKKIQDWKMAVLWLLNMSDGSNDLFSIARRSKLPIQLLIETAFRLKKAGLLKKRGRKENLNKMSAA